MATTKVSKDMTTHFTDPHILYVDPDSGSNSDTGLSPELAKATIQAAYDAIPTVEVDGSSFPINRKQGGVIHLLAGRHDVGTGVNMFKGKVAQLEGPFHAQRKAQTSVKTAMVGAVIYSSEGTQPNALISIGVASDSVQNGYGFVFRQLMFELDGVGEYAILTNNVNNMLVENCAARHYDIATEPDAWLWGSLNTGTSGADASWNRLLNNNVSAMGLYEGKITAGAGQNNNAHIIRDNVSFCDPTRAVGHIYLEAAKGCTLAGNNLEGGTIGMEFGGSVDNSTGNFIAGNTGESIHTWLKAARFIGNIVLDGGSRNPTRDQGDPNDNHKLVDFASTAHGNFVLLATVSAFADLYDQSPEATVNLGSQSKLIRPVNMPAVNESGTFTETIIFDQSSSSGGRTVLKLDQADIDDTFLDFIGTSAADGSRSISEDTTEDGSKFGAFKVEINGVTKWIRVYDDHS